MVAVQDLKGRKCLMPELRLDLFWIMGFTTQNSFYHIIYCITTKTRKWRKGLLPKLRLNLFLIKCFTTQNCYIIYIYCITTD